MKSLVRYVNTVLASSCLVASGAFANEAPAIRNRQLHVDGKPFLALGGELHNSSASSPAVMQAIWNKLDAMHVHTVVATASWADVEPDEGRFEFAAVDALVEQARKRDKRIVLIWFGAFKNASSTYAPTWVRRDTKRFPRAVAEAQLKEAFTYPGAMPKAVLSVFSNSLMAADRAAFVALMKHLAQADPNHRVIMVQVNNETGMLHDSRDHSAAADAAWRLPVPSALLHYLARHQKELKPELNAVWNRQGRRMNGTWAEVFGTDWQADEIFMAWHFGRYMEAMAAAGKKALPLPMYTNGWLGPQQGQPTAGLYPSGGPAKRVLDVWMAAAPSLDLLAPDIYVPDAKSVLADYDHAGNPLFVPESQFKVGDMFWALGQHRAIGYAVFGVEDGRVDGQLAQALAVLNPMTETIARAQSEGRIAGILLDDDRPAEVRLGGLHDSDQEHSAAPQPNASGCRTASSTAPRSAAERNGRSGRPTGTWRSETVRIGD